MRNPRVPSFASEADLSHWDVMVDGSVLLFEDDPDLRRLLTEALREEGLDVEPCGSPLEVSLAAKNRQADLAVVDLWGHSYNALGDDERRVLESITHVIPTILVTGRAWALESNAADLGVLAIVPKPMELFAFSALVQRSVAAVRSDRTAVSPDPAALESTG